MTRLSLTGLMILFAIALLSRPAHAQTGPPTIEEGSKVTLQMTITLPNDHLVIPPHTSEYTHGTKQLIPGLEQALTGLRPGDSRRIELDADHAFGQYDAGKKMTVPRAQLPQTIARGDMATTAEGRPFTVVSLSDESAVVDFNHPLAGKHIVLDIVVLNVKPRA
ncbi:MAG: Peptidyl-prolyl cis-trans isomerase [Nitrospira sp.]|nr:FKBP-type peptidyl-prolyl cis-trans isomerase [Nitrospira sp.]ULA62026.1 MAG: Peptidyl-prolyl cis-trans isomerase [Nitrospira sp.]